MKGVVDPLNENRNKLNKYVLNYHDHIFPLYSLAI